MYRYRVDVTHDMYPTP